MYIQTLETFTGRGMRQSFRPTSMRPLPPTHSYSTPTLNDRVSSFFGSQARSFDPFLFSLPLKFTFMLFNGIVDAFHYHLLGEETIV